LCLPPCGTAPACGETTDAAEAEEQGAGLARPVTQVMQPGAEGQQVLLDGLRPKEDRIAMFLGPSQIGAGQIHRGGGPLHQLAELGQLVVDALEKAGDDDRARARPEAHHLLARDGWRPHWPGSGRYRDPPSPWCSAAPWQ